MKDTREIVMIPTSARKIVKEGSGEQEKIIYWNGKVKCTWNTRLNYLSCSNAKIRKQLEKLQEKPRGKLQPKGTKQEKINTSVSKAEQTNKKANRRKHNKSTGKELINRNQIIESFKVADITTEKELLNEMKMILAEKVLGE